MFEMCRQDKGHVSGRGHGIVVQAFNFFSLVLGIEPFPSFPFPSCPTLLYSGQKVGKCVERIIWGGGEIDEEEEGMGGGGGK